MSSLYGDILGTDAPKKRPGIGLGVPFAPRSRKPTAPVLAPVQIKRVVAAAPVVVHAHDEDEKERDEAEDADKELFELEDLKDVYIPSKPNSYETFCRGRIDRARQERAAEERAALKKREERDFERRKAAAAKAAAALSNFQPPPNEPEPKEPIPTKTQPPLPKSQPPLPKTQPPLPKVQPPLPPAPTSAPSHSPSSNIILNESADDVYKRRMAMSGQTQTAPLKPVEPPPSDTKDGLTKAQQMMQRMGWKEGQGLGLKQQGLTGHLVHSQSRKLVVQEEQVSGRSRVVLLLNMISPSEVDGQLEQETKDECSKYGRVERCMIFQVTDGSVPITEAVRIFVKFSNRNSATEALKELDGRFFGGRQVNASYYDEQRFDKLDLAPKKK